MYGIAVSHPMEPAFEMPDAYGAAPSEKGVTVEPLRIERTTPLCSPKLLPKRRRIRVDDVLGLALIESQLNPVSWADWCKHNGLQLPRRQRPSFDRGFLAVAAAVDGLGVALETERFAESGLTRGELVAITGPGLLPIEQPLHFLFCHSADEESAEIALFARWLREELAR